MDHPHHAGLFYGHGDVNGLNFWAIQNVTARRRRRPGAAPLALGRIVSEALGRTVKSGKDAGPSTRSWTGSSPMASRC